LRGAPPMTKISSAWTTAAAQQRPEDGRDGTGLHTFVESDSAAAADGGHARRGEGG